MERFALVPVGIEIVEQQVPGCHSIARTSAPRCQPPKLTTYFLHAISGKSGGNITYQVCKKAFSNLNVSHPLTLPHENVPVAQSIFWHETAIVVMFYHVLLLSKQGIPPRGKTFFLTQVVICLFKSTILRLYLIPPKLELEENNRRIIETQCIEKTDRKEVTYRATPVKPRVRQEPSMISPTPSSMNSASLCRDQLGAGVPPVRPQRRRMRASAACRTVS